jgi:hypothetical protein
MKRLSLLWIYTVAVTLTATAQEIPLPLDRFKSTDDSHIHTDACFTLHLMETEESKQALREFREWNAAGRPDVRGKRQGDDLITSTVGTKRNFRVLDFNNNNARIMVEFELRHAGARTFIWVQTTEFGETRVSQAIVDAMANGLEISTPATSIDPSKGILENNVSVFGARPNVDATNVVHMLVYRFYPTALPTGSFVAGYFDPVNLSSTNTNSNFADIIHINSNPAVYRDDGRNVDLGSSLNTIAHEDQHLVHARIGQLVTFQNEGQSEWASILNGYPTRSSAYLNSPANVNINLFAWRSGSDVLNDYARAGLFHSYLGNRFGNTRIGSMSYSSQSNVSAYATALDGTGVNFSDALLDFHVANWVNDTSIDGSKYGYNYDQLRNVSVVNPAESYSAVFLDVTTSRTLQFGGAEYLQFTGVKDPEFTLNAASGVRAKLILQPVNGPVEVRDLTTPVTLSGSYQYVTAVLVNPTSSTANATISAEWLPLPFVTENLSYSASSAFFAELPGDATLVDQPTRRFFKGYAMRIDPTYSGRLEQINFTINSRAESKRGTGDLRISLYSAAEIGTEVGTSIARYNPSTLLETMDVHFSEIGSGFNTIDIRDRDWRVSGATNYFILMEVVNHSSDARLEFLLDAGSSNTADTRYFPIRTLIKRVDDSDVTTWGAWSSRNNQLISAKVFSEYTGPLVAPVLSNVPTTKLTALTGTPLSVSVSATGTPSPAFQWRKEGVMIAGQNTSTLSLPSIQPSDAGIYEVRATNFAGFTAYQTFEVSVALNRFTLSQNYPNPFNPSTSIEYVVTNTSKVTLIVYDVTGRVVRTLVDSEQPRGLYQVDFDGRGLASGVYFYQLIATPRSGADGFNSTRKMTILK